MNPKYKHLQNLYSWYELYKKGQRQSEADKTQEQITAYKTKWNLR